MFFNRLTSSRMMFASKTDFIGGNAKKVSPSSWYYFLNYGIKPAQVTGTGPRGHVTKEDLVNFIDKNKL